ncbi:hypothetical protein [Aquimarina brevivitae]|uniref:Uncharacterized protein n=1 Tax=Aquimarina brevivitae TaxID=323412 RepID=A0A4Q7PJL6_9FLAO|nr:hypothetical protein [Aquimarina brevivitae]RZT00021.1 hypothetical protein EV197_1251 [Aquimarina brevivitae]
MKKFVFFNFMAFVLCLSVSFSAISDQDIKVGEELTLASPSSNNYAYINFPKNNFILKKGGILNFKSLPGTKVVVTEINSANDGNTVVTVKRKDGGTFLNSLRTLTIHYEKAIESNEVTK